MAYVADTVIVELQAKLDEYNRNVVKASETFEKGMDKISKSALRAEAQALRSSTAINRAFGALGGAALIRQIQGMADAWTDYSARVGLAVKNMDAAPAVMERLYEMAQRTYSAFDQTAESFISNSNTLRELGKTTQEQLDYTEALNNALVVSGAKAQRAATIQAALAKAMASGKLSGENLNTVIEQGGRVAEALAAELGVSTLQLRKLGQDGKITGDVIFNALTKRIKELRDEAEEMPATISDGFQQVANAVQRYIGTLDQASGVSGAIAQGLVFLAGNFSSVMNAAAAAGAIILSQYVPALVRVGAAQVALIATNPFLLLVSAISAATFALSAFGDEFKPIEGEMANLQDYASVVWNGIKDGVSTAASIIRDQMLAALNLITEAVSGVKVSWDDVWDVVKGVVNNIIGAMGLLYDTAVISFTKLPAAVAEKVIDAMNFMIKIVEEGINKIIRATNSALGALNKLGEWAGVGSLVGEMTEIELTRLENTYAGAGEAAGKALGEAASKAAQDHLGKMGEAWRNAANEIARARVAAESTDDPLSGLGGGGGGGGAGGGAGGGGGGRGRRGRQNELQKEIEQIKERTAALQAETAAQAQLNPLIDDYEYSATKARVTQELLNAAKKAGIAITPELAAHIEELAEAYAQATVASNQLAESQDNARRQAEELRSLGKDVMSGFIKDLKDGKSATDALANALDKVADKLLDMALNSMFSGGGGGGGFLGGILSIFGFARGGIAKNGKPMKTFARGGVSREAAIFGEGPLPEAAVPLPDGRRIPVDLRTNDSGGLGGTETIKIILQDDSGRMSDIADQRIELASGPMLEISVTQSTNMSRKGLPGASGYYQKRGTI